MDLMKAFTEKYTKEEPPVVQVGDTVRVHLKVKEGNRERIQVFEGTVIAKKHGGIEETFTVRRMPRSTAALRRPSPSAASPTASVWRRCSPSTLPPSRRWKWCGTARCAAPSCTTCADVWARRPRSRRPFDPEQKRSGFGPLLFSYQDSLAVQAAEGRRAHV